MRATSLTHWGAFQAHVQAGDIAEVSPLPGDIDPSPLLGNLAGSVRHSSRVRAPAIRRGWLEDGPGPSDRRGADEFVAVQSAIADLRTAIAEEEVALREATFASRGEPLAGPDPDPAP